MGGPPGGLRRSGCQVTADDAGAGFAAERVDRTGQRRREKAVLKADARQVYFRGEWIEVAAGGRRGEKLAAIRFT
jgi:hypothetical protein